MNEGRDQHFFFHKKLAALSWPKHTSNNVTLALANANIADSCPEGEMKVVNRCQIALAANGLSSTDFSF
jgi:hypothetical protein